MDDENLASAGRPPTSDPEPGDRAPVDRVPHRLERAPGERYGAGASSADRPGRVAASPGRVAAVGAIAATVVAGAILVGVLGSFDLGPGMLVLAAFIGWAVALAVIWAMPIRRADRRWLRPTMGALLAGGSVVGGLLLLWAWALVEGGVLGPVAYADARFGLLAPMLVLAAAAVAAVRAR
jgi:hypothetical protein